MGERIQTGEVDNSAGMYQLYSQVIDKGSLSALRELSSMAACGDERAGQLVERIDEAVEEKKLTLRYDRVPPSVITNFAFLLTHPVTSLAAFRRRITVAVETEAPPAGLTFERFSELSLADAARAMWRAKTKREPGGVLLEDWSEADQERLLRREKTKGYPEHQDV